ncbi:MAG: type III-A CRISPR-associated protein Csm2 [Candidatus Cloacimonetes bacterium]|nr:type III-A CRISPR-associated protein Csm2 [Candidatus Cloacimonadota bacterium]
MSFQNSNYGNKSPIRRWDKGFEFFSGDKLNIKWVSEYAKDFSQLMADNRLTGTQLRGFYNEFLRIRDITAPQTERVILIKLLAAKMSYRKTAKSSEIPDDMLTFISELVEQIGESETRFKDACYVMEAIVGFFPKK